MYCNFAEPCFFILTIEMNQIFVGGQEYLLTEVFCIKGVALLISDKWNKLNSDIAQSDIPDIVPVKCYQPPSCPFSYYNAPEKKSTSAFQKKFIKISELRGMVK